MGQTSSGATAGGAGDQVAVASQPRLRDRALVRLESHRLDEALAGGTPPEDSPALALRARQLTALPHRRSMAEAIVGMLREARGGPPNARLRIQPVRGRVVAAGEALGRLAEELALPGPVAARGVAQAELLLTDGTGPLYNPSRRMSVAALAASATANLALTLRV
jgi:hypothetical protein